MILSSPTEARPPILYVALTRRLLSRLAQAMSALVIIATIGCGDDPRINGTPGLAGHGGTAGAGTAGAAGGARGGTGGSGKGGSATGAGGSAGGTGGSIGGTGGGAGGTGGSIGGTGGGAGGTGGSAAGAGGSAGGAGGSAGGAGGSGGVTMQPWPTDDTVVTVDSMNEFPQNVSDLVYEPAGGGDTLWAIQNDPSVLYRLTWNGTIWTGVTDDNWTNGKLIHYPSGTGAPDAEGLARAELSGTAIYVSTERDNGVPNVSHMSVLLYDTRATGATELAAITEWDLTSDLPVSGPNLGLEAITWVPDSFLTANGFYDEFAKAAYDPSRYPNHGTGLFFVGLESNGMIYGYALDHAQGMFQRVATIASGHVSIMSLEFDRDVGNLWAYCDNTCANEASVLRVVGGHFVVQYLYDHPATLPNSNFEGITFQPESQCVQGKKSFFWTDDSLYGGHALYRGTIPCGLLP